MQRCYVVDKLVFADKQEACEYATVCGRDQRDVESAMYVPKSYDYAIRSGNEIKLDGGSLRDCTVRQPQYTWETTTELCSKNGCE